MQDRHLCCPLLFPWPRSGAPHFFHSRIATGPDTPKRRCRCNHTRALLCRIFVANHRRTGRHFTAGAEQFAL